MTAKPGDKATVSVHVAVCIEDAFEVFTNEIDSWWRHGPKYRIAGKRVGRLTFEPMLNGRLLETVALGRGSRTFEVGKVVEWSPPMRLALEWRGVNFAPHEVTFVIVTFTPTETGTLVRLEHLGWSAIRDDHPARHGLTGSEFTAFIGMWWADLLTALRQHVAQKTSRDDHDTA